MENLKDPVQTDLEDFLVKTGLAPAPKGRELEKSELMKSEWVKNNPWFNDDTFLTEIALGIDSALKRKHGNRFPTYDPEAYYRKLDEMLGRFRGSAPTPPASTSRPTRTHALPSKARSYHQASRHSAS